MNLDAMANAPMSRDDFQRFLLELASSARHEPTAWSNETLSTYLEASANWLADVEGFFAYRGEDIPAEPTWQLFAQILVAGRVYE
jgi:hypothetical protein